LPSGERRIIRGAMVSVPSIISPIEAYGVFARNVDQDSVQAIANSVAVASTHGVSHVHLMFQSTGGGIGEGIAMYYLFKSLPFDLTLYNAGSVSSIAVIAYLGAKKRKVSAHATFSIHRSAGRSHGGGGDGRGLGK